MKRNLDKEKKLSVETLRQILSYDKETGIFIWRVRPVTKRGITMFNTRYANTRAGCSRARGYRYINIKPLESFSESRLAWFYSHGIWPKCEIDHINGNTCDNRLVNLREATASQNKANRCVQNTSRSGIKGIRFKKNKWIASVKVCGKSKHLGSFDSKEAASLAFRNAVRDLHGEFAKP